VFSSLFIFKHIILIDIFFIDKDAKHTHHPLNVAVSVASLNAGMNYHQVEDYNAVLGITRQLGRSSYFFIQKWGAQKIANKHFEIIQKAAEDVISFCCKPQGMA
jgi:hypothetical protein